MKAGGSEAPTEAENMMFDTRAATQTHIRITKVHRVFQHRLPEDRPRFIVHCRGYIPGTPVDLALARQTSKMIDSMQSMTLNHMPPGQLASPQGRLFVVAGSLSMGQGLLQRCKILRTGVTIKSIVCRKFNRLPRDTQDSRFRTLCSHIRKLRLGISYLTQRINCG